MEIFVDIADIEKVEKVMAYFPIEGVTTNPNILTKSVKVASNTENAKEDPKQILQGLLADYEAFAKRTGLLVFIEVTAEDAETMVQQAHQLRPHFLVKDENGGEKDCLVVKVPCTKDGYKACQVLSKEGFTVCVTVIHSMLQALMAAKCGATYAAPYVSHIDNIGGDGVESVAEMIEAFQNYGYETKVLGASFRTAQQIQRLATVGCPAVTITPEFFDLLIHHPSTDESLTGFQKAWNDHFGELEITDGLK